MIYGRHIVVISIALSIGREFSLSCAQYYFFASSLLQFTLQARASWWPGRCNMSFSIGIRDSKVKAFRLIASFFQMLANGIALYAKSVYRDFCAARGHKPCRHLSAERAARYDNFGLALRNLRLVW